METRSTNRTSFWARALLLAFVAIATVLAGGGHSLAATATPDMTQLMSKAINAMSTSSPQSGSTIDSNSIAQVGSLLQGGSQSGGDTQMIEKAIAQIIPTDSGDILNVTKLAGPFVSGSSDTASKPVSSTTAIANAVPNGVTIFTQGGTGNPNATNMEKMMKGDISRQGGNYVKVVTPQQFGIVTGQGSMSFDQSRDVGSDIMFKQVVNSIRSNGQPVVIEGYSQSASQNAQTAERLEAAGVAGNKVSFVNYGDPRNENGIEKKFAGLSVFGTTMRGEASETPYHVTSINRQYGLYEDVPDNMGNLASTANWLIGGLPAHGMYGDSIANEQSMSYSEGNRTQVLLLNKSLPLADGLRSIGIPVDAGTEAQLRKVVDAGYDRSKYTEAQNGNAPVAAPASPAPAAAAPAVAADPIVDMAQDWAASQPEPVKQLVDAGINAIEQFANAGNNAPSQSTNIAPQQSYQAPVAAPQVQQAVDSVNAVVTQFAPQAAPMVNDLMNQFAGAFAGR